MWSCHAMPCRMLCYSIIFTSAITWAQEQQNRHLTKHLDIRIYVYNVFAHLMIYCDEKSVWRIIEILPCHFCTATEIQSSTHFLRNSSAMEAICNTSQHKITVIDKIEGFGNEIDWYRYAKPPIYVNIIPISNHKVFQLTTFNHSYILTLTSVFTQFIVIFNMILHHDRESPTFKTNSNRLCIIGLYFFLVYIKNTTRPKLDIGLSSLCAISFG